MHLEAVAPNGPTEHLPDDTCVETEHPQTKEENRSPQRKTRLCENSFTINPTGTMQGPKSGLYGETPAT